MSKSNSPESYSLQTLYKNVTVQITKDEGIYVDRYSSSLHFMKDGIFFPLG